MSRVAITHDVQALVLRRTPYAESDYILSFLTDGLGRISALARGARSSRKRFAGVLEPFHGLALRVEQRSSSELFELRAAKLDRLRCQLVENLHALDVAGRALVWVRQTLAPHTPEPSVWIGVQRLLDTLEATPPETAAVAHSRLAEFGLNLLANLGLGLEFGRCVRCGRACPERSTASVDPGRGGLVCRSCGGARLRVDPDLRRRMVRAASGEIGVLLGQDVRALKVVQDTLEAHTDIG